uniref:Peroxidase n=1 Tax=Ananas comosus var. bracteatus TaxID=296719 RepID=A0A6V7P585_ANACO|nr:unnamed protein product [Ananas comosus var. bracteatus]
MESSNIFLLFSSLLSLLIFSSPPTAAAQLSQNYYSSICPNVESLVHAAVAQKLQLSFAAAPGTLRLFFHDCFVRGCDGSVLLAAANGDDENHSGADLTLSPEAVDTVNRAKAAVDGDPQCTNKVSCADILAISARDVVSLTGGPYYQVELGRLDGRVTSKANVKHNLPGPGYNLDQLNAVFAANGLTQTDMIALSGAHTIGVTHCDKFIRRIYRFKQPLAFNPPMNLTFLRQMRQTCPLNYNPSTFAMLDPATPFKFDNAYYQNLQKEMGLLASDQILFTDQRSRGLVNWFASNQTAFEEAFVAAMTKLGRVGVKNGTEGEIRRVCTTVN